LAELRVSKSELDRIDYLKGAIAGAQAMQARFRADRADALWNEGMGIARRIDWRRVFSECAPEILVIMAQDEAKGENFDEFPLYVIIPRLGVYLNLQDEVSLSIEEGAAIRRSEVVGALNLLRLSAASIDGSKQDNARKLLSGLHKLLLN